MSDFPSIVAMFEKSWKDISRRAVPIIARRLKVDPSNVLTRFSDIRLVPMTEINGRTYSLDGGRTFKIELNSSLIMFLQLAAVLFAGRMLYNKNSIFNIEAEVKVIKSPVPLVESASFAKSLMENFWRGSMSKVVTSTTELASKQTVIANRIAYYAEQFIIAHELAHIALKFEPLGRELSDYSSRRIALFLEEDDSYPEIENWPEDKRANLARKWGEEIAADTLGFAISWDLEDDGPSQLSTYHATEWLFVIQDMLENYYMEVYHQSPPLGTHPWSSLRSNFLKSSIPEGHILNQFIQWEGGFQDTADEILQLCLQL